MVSSQNKLNQLWEMFMSAPKGVVSKKRAQRDLTCSGPTFDRLLRKLRTENRLKIQYDRRKNAFICDCTDRDVTEVPGMSFTQNELAAIFSLRELMKSVSDGVLAEVFCQFWEKVERLCDERSLSLSMWQNRVKILPIGNRDVKDDVFGTIIDSIVKIRLVEIEYKSLGKSPNKRIISPQNIVRYRDNWYVDAWCTHDRVLKTFAMSRIMQVTIKTNRGKRISDKELTKEFASSYGIFTGVADKVAVLEFSGIAAEEVGSETWHKAQIIQKKRNGHLEMKIPYKNDSELVMDILRWSPVVEVKSPVELKEKIKAKLIDSLKNYGLPIKF